jgi:hypothetical protein
MKTAKDMFTSNETRTCEVCGNDYNKCIEVRMNGETHLFDCFECAIHALAPRCAHCGCQIVGHGVESGGVFFCCAHCARHTGMDAMEAHATPERSQI